MEKEDEVLAKEKSNFLAIFKGAKKAVEEKDVLTLKELSNRTVHSASIYQNSDSIALAVIVYSLSKIIERTKYETYSDWPVFAKAVEAGLQNAEQRLQEDEFDGMRNALGKIREAVNNLTSNLRKYIEEVFRRASISKASRLYEHGISMEQTAKLLGISVWELAEYAGKTGIGDVDLGITMSIKKRLQKTMDLFRS